MSTPANNLTEPEVIPEPQARTAKKAVSPHVVDKFAEARKAKKKQRRRAHRATLKRSNTGG